MIGALAAISGFAAAEIDQMDGPTLTFWWNAIMTWRKAEADLADGK